MEGGGRLSAKWPVLLLGSAAAFGAAILFWFDPSQYGFYPHCIFHQVTGYLCPGCGGLRAMHQLLHGNLASAWHFNALLVASLPLLSLWCVTILWRKHFHGRVPGQFRLAWLWSGIAAILLFGILRNVSFGLG
jgi:hypothetical protein